MFLPLGLRSRPDLNCAAGIVSRARYFSLRFAQGLVTRISHPSGSRRPCRVFKHCPWSNRTPEKHRCHAGSICIVTDPVDLNQPLAGYQHRRSTMKSRQWVQQVPIGPDGFLPTPKPDHCCTRINYRNSFSAS